MSLLTAQNLSFGYSDGVLFQDAAFQVEQNDRIGLIGANGTGKTSLFKLITGELQPVSGGIVRGKELKIGYMEQYLACADDSLLYDEALTVFNDCTEMEKELEEINRRLIAESSAELIERQGRLNDELLRRDGLVYKAKTRSALIGLGFSEKDLGLPVSALSGGQRAKLSLCKLLLSNANLLLLDEPTNNLDIEAITWLEDFLSKYKGALLLISHDRYFLDKVTFKTMEIAYKKIVLTVGNYSVFHVLKQERELSIKREYDKNMAEIKRIEEIVTQQKRFNQERNYITIASKEKQIERIKADLVVPDKAAANVSFSFKSEVLSGENVLYVNALSKAFPEKPLFRDFDLTVLRGERAFLLGPNGCGKSTFLKIINREINADSGVFRLGTNVKIGYFDQNIDRLTSSNTVLDEVWDRFRYLNETEIRSALALFLFRGDDVYKKVSALSGGERAKLSLLKIMLSKPNFLILDEPTNHLDIVSREVLEEALGEYDGTLLVVSHDRYFVNKLSTRIVYLTHDGAVGIDGNYESYLAYRLNESSADIKKKPDSAPVNDYKLKKEQESAERKRRTKITKTEKEIADCETEITSIEAKLSLPETSADYQMLLELTDSLQQMKTKLDDLYIQWEHLQEE